MQQKGTIVPFCALQLRKDCMVKIKGQSTETLEQAFGRTLIARRKKKGLSQMDLAVASGYSLRYIGDIERGAKSATMRTMHDLATLLDVRLGILVVEAENLLEIDSKARGRSAKLKV
jgi:ribosome-binding protein aMBF1 (putative translation factor)